MCKIEKIHYWLFLLTTLYLSWESVRGLIYSQDFRVVRWLVLFLVLGALCVILRNQNSKFNDQLPKIILICSILYFTAYLFQGIIAENIRHISRFDTQGSEWAGSAYAVYGLVIATPCAMILYHNKLWKPLSIILIVLAVVISNYYESRILFFTIVLFLFIAPFVMHPKQALLFIMVAVLAWVVSIVILWIGTSHLGDVWGYYGDMISESSPLNPRPMDVGRLAHAHASIQSILVNPYTFMYGYGTYESRWIIPYYLTDIYSISSPQWVNSIPEYIRTTGLPTVICDWGIVGTLLIIMNFVFTGIILFIQRNKWILFGTVLGASFVWLYVSNVLDIILWWLLIIPNGLLLALNKNSKIG